MIGWIERAKLFPASGSQDQFWIERHQVAAAKVFAENALKKQAVFLIPGGMWQVSLIVVFGLHNEFSIRYVSRRWILSIRPRV